MDRKLLLMKARFFGAVVLRSIPIGLMMFCVAIILQLQHFNALAGAIGSALGFAISIMIVVPLDVHGKVNRYFGPITCLLVSVICWLLIGSVFG